MISLFMVLWGWLLGWIRFYRFSFHGFYFLLLELDILFKLRSLLGLVKGKKTNAQVPLKELLKKTMSDFERLHEQGKVHPEKYYAIITGANSGIGLETAKNLASVGYNIVMACRSLDRGREAVTKVENHLRKQNSSVDIKLLQCDLGSFESVKDFTREIKRLGLAVNLLVCNAGIMAPPLSRTKEGYESQLGSNYLAHFLLVHLLLETLHQNGPSRIILISSESHRSGYINWDDLNFEKDYDPFLGYSQSKICIIMFAYELHRYLKAHVAQYEDKITVNVCHPGIIITNISTNIWFPFNLFFDYALPLLAMKATEGCVTTVYLCLSSEVDGVSGKYFDHCQPKQSHALTYDKEEAKKLWKWSVNEIARHHIAINQ